MSDNTEKEHRALLAELSAALAEKTRLATASRIALRDAVCSYVFAQTANGISLETLVKSVRDILGKAEKEMENASDDLAQQLVDWCVEFHRSAAGPAPEPVTLLS
jgi:hypothetical protein